MKSVVAAVRRMRGSGLLWLLASAVLFLLGAMSFNGAGMRNVAELGVGGAVAAIALVVAFLS